jgi:hypothetical protein
VADRSFQWPTATSAPDPKPEPAFGGTLGVIAVALGVGFIAAYTLDAHAHRCDSCGHKWWHLGAFSLGEKAAHTCKRCGAEQWWKSSVPAEYRQAYNSYGHDSWTMPVATQNQAESPNISAAGTPLVPSKNWP